jgi:hypothetical protein
MRLSERRKNMNSSRIGVLLSSLLLAVLVGLVSPRQAWSEDHDFKATLVFRLTSVEQVDDQIFIQATGTGTSALLGPVTVSASVTQSAVGDPCSQYSGDFDLSASGGTIQIHIEGTVCPPPDLISGAWSVTGGTGAFAGATGSGTEEGQQSFSGSDPVTSHWEGTLSY